MVNKIVITYFDGAFGPSYVHWNEKLTITLDEVKYERNEYGKTNNKFEKYFPIKTKWSYKLNTGVDDDFILHDIAPLPYDIYLDYPIFNKIEKVLLLNDYEVHGCDMDTLIIKVYNDDSKHPFEYINCGGISKKYQKELYNLIDSMIPSNVSKPYFMGDD